MNRAPPPFTHALCALLCVAAAGLPPAAAQPSPEGRFAGAWVLRDGPARGRATLTAAFERGLQQLNPFLRTFARSRVNPDALLARREVRLGERFLTTVLTPIARTASERRADARPPWWTSAGSALASPSASEAGASSRSS